MKTHQETLSSRIGRWALRQMLRAAQNIVWRAEEWLHAQEIRLRDEAAKPSFAAEVDPVASAARERAVKRSPRTTRPRLARLKYQHGEFVRSDANASL